MTRNVGEHVYLAGCHSGTGVVELWDASDDSVIRAYAFTINPGPTTATASSAPNVSDLYYGGTNFANAYLRWDNPSWMHDDADCDAAVTDCSTYEHDLKLEWKHHGGWFEVDLQFLIGTLPWQWTIATNPFCTTWTNLPDPYDDCETAGVTPDEGLVELGFGTYKAPLIQAGRDYYGSWTFRNQHGTGSSTQVRLEAAEGHYTGRNSRCTTIAKNKWCVYPISGHETLLKIGSWSYGTPNYVKYGR